MSSQHRVRVVATGLTPASAASILPVDADELDKELTASVANMQSNPLVDVHVCWVDLKDKDPAKKLQDFTKELGVSGPVDAIMIGWGVRGTPTISWLLEDLINHTRQVVPLTCKYIFSTNPHDHLDTIYRVFPEVKPST